MLEFVRSARGARLLLGEELKCKWVDASDADCQPLIFSDLQNNDKFIVMPLPGDNSGHDGLLGNFHVFMKVPEYSDPVAGRRNCIRLFDSTYTGAYVPEDSFVIKVD